MVIGAAAGREGRACGCWRVVAWLSMNEAVGKFSKESKKAPGCTRQMHKYFYFVDFSKFI